MNVQIELCEGASRDHSKSQFFTPPKLAQKLVEWAGVKSVPSNPPIRSMRSMRVLEPSAGNGAIVRPLVAAGAHVMAVEIDTRYIQDLSNALGLGVREHRMVCPASFLECTRGDESWAHKFPSLDLVCGNFPFHLDLDGAFTLHALKFAPRVVAIYPSNVFYSEKRAALWSQVRPTRIAHIAKRPWPGATDYVALELVKRDSWNCVGMGTERMRLEADSVRAEWWLDKWT